jgi:hypothetical protein
LAPESTAVTQPVATLTPATAVTQPVAALTPASEPASVTQPLAALAMLETPIEQPTQLTLIEDPPAKEASPQLDLLASG